MLESSLLGWFNCFESEFFGGLLEGVEMWLKPGQ